MVWKLTFVTPDHDKWFEVFATRKEALIASRALSDDGYKATPTNSDIGLEPMQLSITKHQSVYYGA